MATSTIPFQWPTIPAQLANGSDLNTIKTPGMYFWTNSVANIPTNSPISGQATLIVMQASNAERVVQLVFGGTTNVQGAYFRIGMENNYWSNWKQMA